MTQQLIPTRDSRHDPPPDAIARVRRLVEPELQRAVDLLDDPRMRHIARYQMGWCDKDGADTEGSGKLIRPTLAVLSAEAALGSPDSGVPGAIAVELVHNFSLLHDDIMDRDVERRHRPTGWVAFGEGQAILAGNAMLTLAVEILAGSGLAGRRSLPWLLNAVQWLISGQSQDLALEGQAAVELTEVLHMQAGKTAALLSCASSIGAVAAGAPEHVVAGLAAYGYELGLAFQLVDDILGVVGDSEATGKSSSSDVRAGKRSAPIVAAMSGDSREAARLTELMTGDPPATEAEVSLATRLIVDAGGLEWAAQQADARLAAALGHLDGVDLTGSGVADLSAVARYVVGRDR